MPNSKRGNTDRLRFEHGASWAGARGLGPDADRRLCKSCKGLKLKERGVPNSNTGNLHRAEPQIRVCHLPFRAEQHVSSASLCSRPASTAHRLDDRSGREVVQVDCGGGDGRVAELLGDDGDVDAFGAELRGVRVAQAVGP